jgi:hypothetical protein
MMLVCVRMTNVLEATTFYIQGIVAHYIERGQEGRARLYCPDLSDVWATASSWCNLMEAIPSWQLSDSHEIMHTQRTCTCGHRCACPTILTCAGPWWQLHLKRTVAEGGLWCRMACFAWSRQVCTQRKRNCRHQQCEEQKQRYCIATEESEVQSLNWKGVCSVIPQLHVSGWSHLLCQHVIWHHLRQTQHNVQDPESLCSTVSWRDEDDRCVWVYKVQVCSYFKGFAKTLHIHLYSLCILHVLQNKITRAVTYGVCAQSWPSLVVNVQSGRGGM